MATKSRKSVKSVKTVADAKALVEVISRKGGLDEGVKEIVVANLDEYDEMAVGPDAGELGVSEAILLYLVIDHSGSVDEVADDIIFGINEIVQALRESKGAEEIVVTLVLFADRVEIPADAQAKVKLAHRPIGAFPTITNGHYRAGGSTALYAAMAATLSGAIAYEEQLLAGGTTVQVQVIALTDGADNASGNVTASVVRQMTDEIRTKRPEFTLAFVGFKTYESAHVDYKQVAQDVGFGDVLEIDLRDPDPYQRRHLVRQTLHRVSTSSVARSKKVVDPNAGSGSFFDANQP